MKLLQKLLREEAGMETVEWAILAALIVVGLIVIITGIGTNVHTAFSALKTGTTP